MSALPRITVITPSYNQGQFIQATIESVLEQDYPDLEYIVMDGGSKDQTVDVLKAYDGRVRWVSEEDRGQSHAINKGLRRATGDVIAFLNSDDVYESGALIRVGHFFAEHPEAQWVTGKCCTVDQDGNEIRKAITAYKNFWLRVGSQTALTVLNYISQPATFWTRELVETVGDFDERWHYAMDYDYWLRARRHFKLWFLAESLASFRVHPSSKAGSSARAQFDVDLEIARHHVPSRLLVGLHALHNSTAVSIYRMLLVGRE